MSPVDEESHARGRGTRARHIRDPAAKHLIHPDDPPVKPEYVVEKMYNHVSNYNRQSNRLGKGLPLNPPAYLNAYALDKDQMNIQCCTRQIIIKKNRPRDMQLRVNRMPLNRLINPP